MDALEFKNIDALVMASGVNRIPLYEGYAPGYKALIPLHGRPSIHYVLDALASSRAVNRICIVGPEQLMRQEIGCRPDAGVFSYEPGGDSLLASMTAGLRHFRKSSMVLVISADLPLLTPDAIRDFLKACPAERAEYNENLFISVVPRNCYTGPYERFTKPFNRFRDISICHGNLFAATPGLIDLPSAVSRVNRLYRGRKSALTSALALGLDIALMYMIGVELLHVVKLRQMARYASKRFGFGVYPVVVSHPEITMDVDEPGDYEFVREFLAGQCKSELKCA